MSTHATLQPSGRLTLVLIAGTVPGVVAGCVIRAVFLPGMAVSDFTVAAVLVPLGAWLALARAPEPDSRRSRLLRAALVVIAAAVGCVGGIYGVGGGSILAPVLIGDGHPWPGPRLPRSPPPSLPRWPGC